MSLKGYKTVLREARDEVVINKSRFIGHAAPVSSTGSDGSNSGRPRSSGRKNRSRRTARTSPSLRNEGNRNKPWQRFYPQNTFPNPIRLKSC